MERESLGRARLWLGGLAGGGVVLAHQLAYLTAAPDPHERAELLRAAGHRDWSLIVALATGLVIAGLTGFVRRGLGGGTESLSWRALAARLVLLQTGAFLVLEASERALTGGDPSSLLAEPVVILGLLLQAVVAVIGAGLLQALGRAVAFWRARGMRRRRPTLRISSPRPLLGLPRFSVSTGGGDLRGPPLTAL